MSSRIFVAIDTPDLARAKTIAARVRNHVGGLKLGLEFFCANGRQGVREIGRVDRDVDGAAAHAVGQILLSVASRASPLPVVTG